ncbi:MAG: hypothetical protein HOD63_13145 [Bacteroidetes bacterium]|jgi:hypothetical protein|nr:hypothetical protein [Bacteroidota bacterium]MBT3422982.1 hypothetical protein [Bacteroidota bacterium]MBT3802952.1 hypothetical protein [Bacteroidota bacterium]MBT3935983.1 hypothetical protein [Bacteroidota bacterium]MBT4339532.1 hypothetical protein [Bacteroidota bacterium]
MENRFKNNHELQSLVNALGLVEARRKEEIDEYQFPFMARNSEIVQLSFLQ